jgi:hypothetical protein
VQAVAEVHDTPKKAAPVGLAVDCTDQLDPSQRSTNGAWPSVLPTAVHAVVEVHDTPLSEL